jgi:hypothetical protein
MLGTPKRKPRGELRGSSPKLLKISYFPAIFAAIGPMIGNINFSC